MKLASRMDVLEAEGAFKVLADAQRLEREGRDIVHFEIGQPDFETPKHIAKAAISAIRAGKTRYTPSLGIHKLREVLADYTTKQRGVATKYSEIAVAPSCKTALFTALAATVEPGAEVIYPDPGFPAYNIVVRFFGGKPVPIPLIEERQFSFDMGIFRKKISKKTKVIILNYPSNPTGTIIPKKDLEEIAALAAHYDCWIITDEIYNRILYTDQSYQSMYSLPKMKKRTLIVDGFSKTYSMTGWRLGWLVAPESIMERVDFFLTHSVACSATFTQEAGVVAITGSQVPVEEMVSKFRERRDFVVSQLNKIKGIQCLQPHGAFYVFFNITSFGITSKEMARYILEKAGVALLDGTAFGKYGEGYLRISYATSRTNLKLGIDRIKKALSKL